MITFFSILEKKSLTGIFYLENGISYWRAFTPLELAIIDELKSQNNQNEQTIARNIEVIKLNQQAQESVDNEVRIANQIDYELAVKKDQERALLEAQSIVNSIKAPTLEYLINYAEQKSIGIVDALADWVEANPYYYVRTDLKEQVEAMYIKIKKAEEVAASTLLMNKMIEVGMTEALEEMFRIQK